MSVFKTYDIRGAYPEAVHERLAEQVGRAAVRVCGYTAVVVGRDTRKGSDSLAKALIDGLREAGCAVTDLGLCSTPMLAFAVPFSKSDGGFMVTGSHNPEHFNGIKVYAGSGLVIGFNDGLAAIEETIAQDQLPTSENRGAYSTRDISGEYLAHLLKHADMIDPYTVAIDTAGGVVGTYLPRLFAKLPCELLPLSFEPDDSFFGRLPDPTDWTNLEELRTHVQESRADIGLAFDGDGDRVVFVDETGQPVRSDWITALLASDVLAATPDAAILYDRRSSRIVEETILAHGGRPIPCQVGHTFFKKMMREESAAFGGELSGHYYFTELDGCDNGEMAMLQVLTIMSRSGKKLSELVQPFNKYFAIHERSYYTKDPAQAMTAIEKAFCPTLDAPEQHDGLQISTPTWWCNVRLSNSEPVLRLNLEATSAETRDEMAAHFDAILRKDDE